ncbi:MAG: hypothetical protein HUJ56_06235, partial [Erysipelotrichaceae bacterium]|nr:hypothetical protein [Erysipelotrichaceae bacterium]
VLRKYAESGEFDPVLQQKLEQAYYASPIHHVSAAAPPIALFGGYGDDGCNIAFKQSLRTFDTLQEVGALVYLFGNTCGKYGEMPEVQSAISEFFRRHLKGEN